MDIPKNNVIDIIIVKQISKLEFEKDVINELMEMFDVKQKERPSKEKERTKINQPTQSQ